MKKFIEDRRIGQEHRESKTLDCGFHGRRSQNLNGLLKHSSRRRTLAGTDSSIEADFHKLESLRFANDTQSTTTFSDKQK